MKKEVDLTSGVLWKQILAFGVPLMFSNILQVVFNLADIAVVGRFAGSIALAAVGSTALIVVLFTYTLIGMSGGINVQTAFSIGAGNEKEIEASVHTSAILSLILGALLLVLGEIFIVPILEILHTRPELIEAAESYLRIYLIGMPALAMYNYGNAVLSAAGETRKPLIYLSIAGVINVVLNLIFVIVFKMEVVGVAVASIISQYISAILILLALIRGIGGCRLYLDLKHLKLSPKTTTRVLVLGIPAAMQGAIFTIANLFLQAGINSFSASVVAGNAAACNADNLIFDIMAAFYTACASFMGQNLGAGKKLRVKQSYIYCLMYSVLVAMLYGALLRIFGRQFLSLFSTDEEVIRAGLERIGVMTLCYWVSAFMDCTIAASRALNKSFVPTVIVILGSCVFRILWIYTVFAIFRTTTSLYMLYIFSWAITATAEILYFIPNYKKRMASVPAI